MDLIRIHSQEPTERNALDWPVDDAYTRCPAVTDESGSPTLPDDHEGASAHNYMLPEDQQKEFETLWQSRKADAENVAENNARVTFRQWQRDRLSLEQAIDASLKEYAELYERAHALRLMFEEEKAQWSRKIQQERASERAEETSCWAVKRQRTDDWGVGYASALPFQHRVGHQYGHQVSPYSFDYTQGEVRGTLADEFQYAAEDSQQDQEQANALEQTAVGGAIGFSKHSAASVPTDGAQRSTDALTLTPLKKPQKKFTVPVKMT